MTSSVHPPLELMKKAMTGDESALSALIQHYHALLRGRFQQSLPQRWNGLLSVDDVLQETYTDAFLGIKSFSPRGENAFEAWMTTIAKNNLRNAIEGLEAEKRGGNHRRVVADGPDESYVGLFELLEGSTTSPSGKVEKNEAKALLQESINRLPPDYRMVVMLYDIEGHPARDVAQTMKRSEGAVFMLRARAHQTLRQLLEGTLGSPSKSA